MRGTLLSTALIATVAAQGVTETIKPPGAAPAECQANADGRWELSVEPIAPAATIAPAPPVAGVPVAPVPVSSSSSSASATTVSTVPIGTVPGMPVAPIVKRAEPVKNTLLVTVTNGVLKDRYNRVGYIAANRQFQFDAPPQAGALFTGGWSLCNNGTLALGPSAVFYRCLSGDFYNLYDQKWAPHCTGIFIHATKASQEAVDEVPPLAPNAPAPPPPGPAPASSTLSASSSVSASTTPVVVVPPASTTITTNSVAASSASSLSSLASSASTAASSASSSAIQVGSTIIPSAGPPVEPSQAGSGNMNSVGAATGLSMLAVMAAFALLM